ncbi:MULTISPECIES: NADH-quinone oxidoreductase subunit L [Rhodomicrobium]|uniref:NADH-quinone oxidoreductase subunit L n=1 Tax=Rhodomicrobium TaxID=1068 RepID=UPI000B4C1C01|nr:MULTISPECIES: NADH-quinone oxidoreductase subunit L [Rhodomicrobium]
MYSAIVFLPLIGALIAGLFGRWLGARPAGLITSALLTTGAVLSWVAFYRVGLSGEDARIPIMEWVRSGELQANWSLRIDTLTAVMLVVVNTVSALVHIYSIGYMSHDDSQPRFFAYLSLFTFAMLMLVTADNLLQLFMGWEGVGLASYLLIGFWYHKPSANAAAIKAFVVNRVGDFGFALGIFGVFTVFGTISFDAIFASAPDHVGKTMEFLGYQLDTLTTLCLLLFVGAMGKSAQFLLHTWLPDAMEGPTPVSALIHAATMVTAGVFMVARLSPLFELAPVALQVVTGIGALTAIFAATVGIAQNDIKRVIAYSTCSQLGYMFVAMGVGAYSAGMFHLFTHAFFKALLFLGAGSVIHALHDEQDLRNMGGLRKSIPLTFALMVIGTLALTGFPFTAGYFSKDTIIEVAYARETEVANWAFWLLLAAAFLTSAYSWRLIFMAFFGKPRYDEHHVHPHESPWVMLVPLFVLAAGALFAGYLGKDYFVGEDYAHFWRGALFTGPDNHILEHAHHSPAWVVWSPTVMMVAGFVVAWFSYIAVPSTPAVLIKTFKPIHAFLYNKWYIDELYDLIFVRPYIWLSRQLWKIGDGRIIDGLGPDGISARVIDVTNRVVRLQTGFVYHYAFVMLIGIALIVSYFAYVYWAQFWKGY